MSFDFVFAIEKIILVFVIMNLRLNSIFLASYFMHAHMLAHNTSSQLSAQFVADNEWNLFYLENSVHQIKKNILKYVYICTELIKWIQSFRLCVVMKNSSVNIIIYLYI